MKIELHVHTSEGSTCAKVKAEDIILDYASKKIDGVVITNHYSKHIYETFKDNLNDKFLKGYLNAKKMGQRVGIKVFYGMELNLSNHPNDYLIYGIKADFLEKYPTIFEESLEKVAEIVHDENGVIFQAHPFRKPCEIMGAEFLDGYEFNFTQFHNNNNELLIQWVKQHKNQYPHLQFICGSDCHGHESCALGVFNTLEDVDSNEDLVVALKKYHNNYLSNQKTP